MQKNELLIYHLMANLDYFFNESSTLFHIAKYEIYFIQGN